MSNSDKRALNSPTVRFSVRDLEGKFCEDLSEKEMEAVTGGISIASISYNNQIRTSKNVSITIRPNSVSVRATSITTSKI